MSPLKIENEGAVVHIYLERGKGGETGSFKDSPDLNLRKGKSYTVKAGETVGVAISFGLFSGRRAKCFKVAGEVDGGWVGETRICSKVEEYPLATRVKVTPTRSRGY